jgi:cytochrome c oxidase assembly factor CtaG
MTLTHPDRPLAPHDLWGAWNLDPLVVLLLLLAAWAFGAGYVRGRARPIDRRRLRYYVGALVVLAVALLSPLDALSRALASAHMVQHLLLVLVAAPLLAFSAPGATLTRGMPGRLRRGLGQWRGRLA